METPSPEIAPQSSLIDCGGLDALIGALSAEGYTVIGPTLGDGAIVYDEIRSAVQLPAGWTETQSPGAYQLARRGDGALFGYAVGPHSWKKLLHAPVLRLWRAQRHHDGSITAQTDPPPPLRYAFIGVRSCDLHAIGIQDRVLIGGQYRDPHYAARRGGVFIVAVNCIVAGGTCFCVSMNTGPRVRRGYDLALTELIDGERHEFLVETGSTRGAAILNRIPKRPAADSDRQSASQATERAASQMGRQLDTGGIKELLLNNLEHPRWDDVAARCLACGNCTMVCPTCFCTTVEDHTDLAAGAAERIRSWDSCYTMDFSHLHGGSVRASIKSRYRQWLTHKMATWFDQFGTSGCVGCGRWITWCPVGIDLTEEVAAIRSGRRDDNG